MNHKWLDSDAPSKDILAVQITNVTIPIAVSLEIENDCVKPDEPAASVSTTDEEDKENSLNQSENSDKSPSTNYTTTVGAKLVLEKSLSISLFPDAPTTPKVCRKMLYDDQNDLNSQVKEIVKKYQTSENQTLETQGDCHPTTPTKPPTIEIDKGIIC
jgi:hypothetical protein